MIHHIYFRKPLANVLVRYSVESAIPYEMSAHKEYKEFAEKTLGLPIPSILVLIKS